MGYQLDRYEPTPAGDPFSIVESPWYSSTRWFAAGLTFDYAHNLLVAEHVDPGGTCSRSAPIAHHQAGASRRSPARSAIASALSLSVPIVLVAERHGVRGRRPERHDRRRSARRRARAPVRRARLGADAERVGVSVDPGRRRGSSSPATPACAAWRASPPAGSGAIRFAGRCNALVPRPQDARCSSTHALADGQHRRQRGPAVGGRRLSGPRRTPQRRPRGDHVASRSPAICPSVRASPRSRLFGTARYAVTDQIVLGVGVGGSLAGEPGPPDVARAVLDRVRAGPHAWLELRERDRASRRGWPHRRCRGRRRQDEDAARQAVRVDGDHARSDGRARR